MAYDHRQMRTPGGVAQMILPSVILGGFACVALLAAEEMIRKGNPIGWLALLGACFIGVFIVFLIVLHVRNQALWDWYCRTGHVPQPKRGGFWKGAGIGALFGFLGLMLAIKLTTGTQTIDGQPMNANAWIVVGMVYGGMFFFPCVVVPALVLGWAKRAWDRTAIPPPHKNVSGPGGSEWQTRK